MNEKIDNIKIEEKTPDVSPDFFSLNDDEIVATEKKKERRGRHKKDCDCEKCEKKRKEKQEQENLEIELGEETFKPLVFIINSYVQKKSKFWALDEVEQEKLPKILADLCERYLPNFSPFLIEHKEIAALIFLLSSYTVKRYFVFLMKAESENES